MLSISVLLAVSVLRLDSVQRDDNLVVGREYYAKAEFRKAAAHLQAACTKNSVADACYWAGMSYETLGDIATPFGCSMNSKAHVYFAKALDLAPGNRIYRNALFAFLLNEADCSRKALREASALLSATPKSDPDYSDMQQRLDDARRFNRSVDVQVGKLFLLVPRTSYHMATATAAALPRHRRTLERGSAVARSN